MTTTTFTVDSCKFETPDGVNLYARIRDDLVIVLLHPFSLLGGSQVLLRGIAAGLAEKGYRAVTFDIRGAGKSSGRASLTGFSEIRYLIAVCKWVCDNLSTQRSLLVGSSAGSAVDQVEQVVGYVSLGYPFGWIPSILFGRHHKSHSAVSETKTLCNGAPVMDSPV